MPDLPTPPTAPASQAPPPPSPGAPCAGLSARPPVPVQVQVLARLQAWLRAWRAPVLLVLGVSAVHLWLLNDVRRPPPPTGAERRVSAAAAPFRLEPPAGTRPAASGAERVGVPRSLPPMAQTPPAAPVVSVRLLPPAPRQGSRRQEGSPAAAPTHGVSNGSSGSAGTPTPATSTTATTPATPATTAPSSRHAAPADAAPTPTTTPPTPTPSASDVSPAADPGPAAAHVASAVPADPPASLHDDAQDLAAADAAATGQAPPLYRTQRPPPVQLRYQLLYNGRRGHATLRWTVDAPATGPAPASDGESTPAAYQLQLQGLSDDGLPAALVEMDSHGHWGAAGVAPQRFLDRRGGRRWRAAHFRADIGRIGYSGSAAEHPLWPGAQDRLSWLAQLAAVLQAAATPPAALTLYIADARGRAETWQLHRQPQADQPPTESGLLHWRHEPLRPDGLRVEVWTDPALGHWPRRVRHTALRSGDVFEMHLSDAGPGPR